MRLKVKFRTEEFTRTLRRYRELSKRDPETIVNTKAFYIARRAVLETPKTPAEKIREFVGLRSGQVIGRIINKRRGARGERGLYGDAMAKAVGLVLAARLRSRAFMKSGWLPAIKALAPLAEKRGAPKSDRSAKVKGKDNGYARPARGAGWVARSIIANMAQARWDRGKAMEEGLAALKRAFDAETQSMKEYIERKQKETAHKAGVKTK